MSATCRSCGAEIVWGEWRSSGKPVPIDAKPTKDGRLALVNGKVHHWAEPVDGPLHRERWTAHFATCPDAGDWRSR